MKGREEPQDQCFLGRNCVSNIWGINEGERDRGRGTWASEWAGLRSPGQLAPAPEGLGGTIPWSSAPGQSSEAGDSLDERNMGVE